MRAEKKKARLAPEQRRKQIQKVEVKGDYAYLEAESERKGVLDVAGFEKTAERLEGRAGAPLGRAAAIASCRPERPREGSTGGRRQNGDDGENRTRGSMENKVRLVDGIRTVGFRKWYRAS